MQLPFLYPFFPFFSYQLQSYTVKDNKVPAIVLFKPAFLRIQITQLPKGTQKHCNDPTLGLLHPSTGSLVLGQKRKRRKKYIQMHIFIFSMYFHYLLPIATSCLSSYTLIKVLHGRNHFHSLSSTMECSP